MSTYLNVRMRTRWTCPECGGRSRMVRSELLPSASHFSTQQCREPVCSWAGQATHGATEERRPSKLDSDTLAQLRYLNDALRNLRIPQWICPACGNTCLIRSSEQPLDDWRKVWMECRYSACGWEGIGEYQIRKTLSPSGIPNPRYKRQMVHLGDQVKWEEKRPALKSELDFIREMEIEDMERANRYRPANPTV